MKTAIIGYCGSGKSTLAQTLSARDGRPCLHMDRIGFSKNWIERDTEEGRALMRAFLDGNGAWIIDGNYKRFLLAERLEQADEILFFNFPRFVCFYQAFCRYLRCRGTVRDSVAEGCTEKFDWEFMRWILRDGRTKGARDAYAAILAQYPDKTTVFRRRRDVTAYLARSPREPVN